MFLIWILQCISAVESAGGLTWSLNASRNRTRRHIACGDMKYPHSGICCLNCPAGTHVKQHCTGDSQRGVCEPCDFGWYTEHDNGLSECLHCTKCRSDQELVEQCSSIRNSQCQCKKGYYCLPDQPCEICKTCARCGEDEEVAESCTPTSNTVCRKQANTQPSAVGLVFSVLVPVVILIVFVAVLYRKGPECCKKAVVLFCPRGATKKKASVSSVEDGDNDLNSALEARGGQNQPFIIQTGIQPENERFRRLIPVNGEESLKRSFDLFEEIDVTYHSRFFRFLGLSDNAIKNAESLTLEDRVYELLKVWLEKEGMKADLNTLLEALLHLNQRLSAENISGKAVSYGYYKYEEDEDE